MARFAGGKAPFLRLSDQPNQGTGIIMRDFLIGLFPVILFAWYKNGIKVYVDGNINFLEMLYPLVFILLGGLLSLIMEGLFFIITDKDCHNLKNLMLKLSTSFALIPGLILALVLPLYTPVWVLIFGAFMGTIVGKMLFGGFGHNIFNPALLGYIAIGFTLSGVITAAGGVFNASEVLVDAYAGATPLTNLAAVKDISYAKLVEPYGNLWNFFLGTIPGALGETSALVILVSYVWLAVRKVIKWFTPLIYVGTVFVLSWLIGIISGDSGIWFPLYSVFSGGLMFGAVFMATEPVTTPRNPLGKIFFALFLGAFTVLFRFVGNYPEGVGTSIIVMNIFALPLDQATAVIRARGLKKETLVKVGVLTALLLVIIVYAVIKSGTVYGMFINMVAGIGRLM
ncbi:MAG: RnfABCDGE type electron transport complex subunit D [Bacilli bacterium]|nr:RnfABCDGE type electron transport complex subunit D [Bacilli bacterium]MBN2696610.1 RnfABCDGE type electron transport complex subunit D [Bacilli bacterium]